MSSFVATPEAEAEAKRLYEEGHNFVEIAEILGCAKSTARRLVRGREMYYLFTEKTLKEWNTLNRRYGAKEKEHGLSGHETDHTN